MNNISYLEISDEVTKETRKIAYERTSGLGQSEVLFIPGFLSHMSGVKANTLHTFCKTNNITYTRYDPTGLGASKSFPLYKTRLSHWIEDAETVLNYFEKPKIVVASSLGAWMALKLCQKYPEKFQALLLLAPGVNVTKQFVDTLSQHLPKTELERLERGESFEFAYPEYGMVSLSKVLIEDMYKNEIDFSSTLKVPFPVRIIHGTRDEDVNYTKSLHLMEKLECEDLHVVIIKDAYHRLSTEKNLKRKIFFKEYGMSY
ncbi:Mycophenolic acid acyl-glucuronide esterase, mitochondrial [Armadillidium vulgare]|nr:Mycophenolic acid acyl-glucuronide esterase, mitochondrial [Armadillidium vulgare]